MNNIKTFLLILIQRKRILEIEGVFIPQYLSFPSWRGIDNVHPSESWSVFALQAQNCGHPTLQAAQEHYYKYLEHKKKLKKIIHSIDPEAWVALKKKNHG